MKLWIESARQDFPGLMGETRPQEAGGVEGAYVRTLTTEDQFLACVASIPGHEPPLSLHGALAALESGVPLEAVTESLLSDLPESIYLPVALLQVRQGSRASLIECDAPPLFMARGGRLVLPPVVEEEFGGRLIRRCEFDLHDGDHMALVSEGFLQGVSWDRRWGWRDIAVATRRLTETRCDAQQLATALIRQYQRLLGGKADSVPETGTVSGVSSKLEAGNTYPAPGFQYAVSVLAMFVRPIRTLTLWSGPPTNRAADGEMVRRLVAEEDVRVICGDTSAEIAARLLGARLVIERRPSDGWREVPPTSRMIGSDGVEKLDLVTEGVVTMNVARERLALARSSSDLAGQGDGASRLAQLLLDSDKIQLLVGMAVNPAQVAPDGTPLRRMIVGNLVDDLKSRGKIVSVEYF